VRAHISDLTARAWLQLAARDTSSSVGRRALREARREARRIRKLDAAVYTPLADVIEAGVALQRANDDEARRQLRGALDAFEALDLHGHAFATGQLLETLGDDVTKTLPEADTPKDAARFTSALGLTPRSS